MNKEGFVPTRLSMITLLFGSMLILMGGAAVAPALPLISEVFPQYDDIWITMIISLPSLAIAITGLAVGMLADRIGKVRVLMLSLAVFAFAGISGFLIDDLPLLLVSRFLVGMGIAGLTSCLTALISEYYTGTVRVRVLSYQSAAMGIGVLILETSDGALAGLGWHYPFLIYGLGFVILALVIVSLREPSAAMAPSGAQTAERNSDRTVVIYGYATIFAAMLLMFALPSKLPTYVSAVLGETSLVSGVILGIHGTVEAAVTLMYKRISDHMNRFLMIPCGFTIMGVGYLMFFLPPSLPVTVVIGCMIGIGIALITPTVVNLLAEQVTPKTSGRIMGGYSTLLNLGQLVCTFLIAAMLMLVSGTGEALAAIGVIAAVVAVLFAAFYLVKGKTMDGRFISS